jgi:hypothetical protein
MKTVVHEQIDVGDLPEERGKATTAVETIQTRWIWSRNVIFRSRRGDDTRVG